MITSSSESVTWLASQLRQAFRHGRAGQALEHVGGGRAGIDEAFQQRIAGHAVGAVQAGEGGFADGVEARHVGMPVLVDEHAAAGIVSGRHYRDRLLGNVDAEVQAALVDGGEVRLDELGRLVADVQVDAVDPQTLHFMVDGAGHDIPGRQFATRVEARHETLAIGQAEQGAFAAQCLGDEETLGLRVVQAGRVELVELQVADPAAGAPGHGDAVAGVAVGIAGIKVDLARATGGQHAEAGTEGIDFAAFPIQHVGAQAALARQAELALGDQVDRHPLRQQLDVRSPPGLGQQGIEDRGAGGVGGMDDAPVAVPAFAGQVVFEAAFLVVVLLVAGEGHPCSISHWIASRLCSTVKRTASSRHRPPPATRVSSTWDSTVSVSSSTAATPPWAQ